MNICDKRNINIGTSDCDWGLKVLSHIIPVPSLDVKISVQDQKRIFDYVREKSLHVDPLQRFYPIAARIEEVDDESTEAVVGSLNGGYEEELLEGRFKYRIKWPSRVFRDRILMKYRNFTGGAYFINSENIFLGMRNQDGTLSPRAITIRTDGGGLSSSGGDVKTFDWIIDLGFKSEFINGVTGIRLRPTDRISDLRGFRDLEILVLSVASGVANVQLVTGGDNYNVYNTYKTQFSDAANWRVNDQEATSVTADDDTESFKVSIGTGMSEINIAPVDILKTAGVIGFEGVSVVVTSE